MPQVKELKELDVAGSATNERGRYGSSMAPFDKGFSYLPLFMFLRRRYGLQEKDCYVLRVPNILSVTRNSKPVTGGNCVDPPTI
jgi:hypothetical protein